MSEANHVVPGPGARVPERTGSSVRRLLACTAVTVLASVLPARRDPIHLRTSDGLSLVGELAMPLHADPAATIVTRSCELWRSV